MIKVTKISYSKSFEIVLREGTVWEKIGLEAELGEEETPEQGLSELKVIVDTFHKEHLPQPTEEDTYTTVPLGKKQPVKLVPDAMTIASYNKFKNNGNTAMVQTLEEMYKFPENA